VKSQADINDNIAEFSMTPSMLDFYVTAIGVDAAAEHEYVVEAYAEAMKSTQILTVDENLYITYYTYFGLAEACRISTKRNYNPYLFSDQYAELSDAWGTVERNLNLTSEQKEKARVWVDEQLADTFAMFERLYKYDQYYYDLCQSNYTEMSSKYYFLEKERGWN
jgi:hypothetical protein